MDFLSDIWRAWNDQWGASVATILALIALLLNVGKETKQLVTHVARWKIWGIVPSLLRNAIRKYRSWRAESILRRALEGETFRVGIRNYDDSLRSDPWLSTRNLLRGITPDKPHWLNDHYVANALESLSAEGKVSKAIRYSPQSWPPYAVGFLFMSVREGGSAQTMSADIETNGKCLAYQTFDLCPEPPRFDVRVSRETVSLSETRTTTSFPLSNLASPCRECWKNEYREPDLLMLVEAFLKNDFARFTIPEITGANGELQEALVDLFLKCDYAPEVNLLKPLVEQAIAIRQEQISARTPESQGVWQPDDKRELTATLLEHIKSQSKG